MPAEVLEQHLQQQVLAFLQDKVHPGGTLLLAFSGGLDSRVLLDVLVNLHSQLEVQLHAIYVHHGLSQHADAWGVFCQATCAELSVPFSIAYVEVPRDSGLGVEASARQARYQALLAVPAQHVLLAHHQDDQAETLLLQLLRGAGVKGLSAMAPQDTQRRLLRPLLNVTRADIFAYAQQRGLQWIEDDSNSDEHYDRNFLRHQVMPGLLQRFPAAATTLARSAAHMAEAAQLLDELASLDAGDWSAQLPLARFADISPARARNLLRWWLSAQSLNIPSALSWTMPSTAHLQDMLAQLLQARPDAAINLSLNAAYALRRFQGQAYVVSLQPAVELAVQWQGEAELQLPDGSRLCFEQVAGAGLALQRLGITRLRISSRQGGERFKPQRDRPTRTLKHLLQEADMPPWQRDRLPLVYCDDTLAVVPGIGVASQMQAAAHEMGWHITWQYP